MPLFFGREQRCQLVPLWSQFGVVAQGPEFLLNPMDESRCGPWRPLCDERPDFSQVVLGLFSLCGGFAAC